MTSQVMALRRSGRSMVRVRTAPRRSARRPGTGSTAGTGGRSAVAMTRTVPDPAGDRGRPRYRDAIPTTALLSFRLGGTDGVAVEAAKWA